MSRSLLLSSWVLILLCACTDEQAGASSSTNNSTQFTQLWAQAWDAARAWQKDAQLVGMNATVGGDGALKLDAGGGGGATPLVFTFVSKGAGASLYVQADKEGTLKTSPMSGVMGSTDITIPDKVRDLADAVAEARKAGAPADGNLMVMLVPQPGGAGYEWMLTDVSKGAAYYVGPTGGASNQPGQATAARNEASREDEARRRPGAAAKARARVRPAASAEQFRHRLARLQTARRRPGRVRHLHGQAAERVPRQPPEPRAGERDRS